MVNIGRAIEDIGIDLNSDYSISNMINALNEYAASSGSNSVYCTYINTTGSRTMYGCMPSGSMQSVSAATGSSTLGHQIDTFRGLAIGCNGSWSYDYEPCTALWNATDQDNYGSYKGFYLYRMPSSSVTVHTDFDGTGTRSLYGMLCCYTSSCVVGDSFNG